MTNTKRTVGRPKKPQLPNAPDRTTQTIRNIDAIAMQKLRVYAVHHRITLGEAVSRAAHKLADSLQISLTE